MSQAEGLILFWVAVALLTITAGALGLWCDSAIKSRKRRMQNARYLAEWMRREVRS